MSDLFESPVYIDTLMPCIRNRHWKWDESCHMFADVGNLDALHAFAARIGLKRAWFQNHKDLPHYDLNKSKRALALTKGAVELDRRETVQRIRAWRTHKAAAGKTT